MSSKKEAFEDESYPSTLNQSGQANIPLPVRQKLGLKPRDKIRFIVDNKENVIRLEKAKGD